MKLKSQPNFLQTLVPGCGQKGCEKRSDLSIVQNRESFNKLNGSSASSVFSKIWLSANRGWQQQEEMLRSGNCDKSSSSGGWKSQLLSVHGKKRDLFNKLPMLVKLKKMFFSRILYLIYFSSTASLMKTKFVDLSV